MRLGLAFPQHRDGASRDSELIARADALGVDGVLLDESAGLDPFVSAAALVCVASHAFIAVEIGVGMHPVHLAEKAAVADQILGGRLMLILRGENATDLVEAASILADASRSRPFSSAGGRWPVPARRHENADARWTQIRVTPSPAQLSLPLFVSGAAGRDAALELGLPYFSDADESADELTAFWGELQARHGVIASRLLRAGRRPNPGDLADIDRGLEQDRLGWGLEFAFLTAASGEPWNVAAVETIADAVRPRVQLAALPAGTTDFWNATIDVDRAAPEKTFKEGAACG
ncbi:hypothetical protein BH09ACT6_BH09ACT6_05710 [soil metagenome]